MVVVIPARMESARFPGKALANETGTPLVLHVVQQAGSASLVDRVIVAAPEGPIIDAVQAAGGEAIATRDDHPNGTSRIAEVARTLDAEIIVNVQGDEPEIDPDTINAVVDALRENPDCPMSTVASPFGEADDLHNPNLVKVVLDRNGRALYFSRAPIPHHRDSDEPTESAPLRHVGIYAYRRAFLAEFAEWSPTPLEEAEKLEQLRVLEHGRSIAVAIRTCHHQGIDTPEQYAEFVARCRTRQPG